MIDLNKLAKDFSSDELENYELIQNGDWIDDGRYSFKDTVIKYQDKFYCIYESRSGSYFTYYNYGEPNACEVEPYEVTITQYRPVK
jgi:hypothetical protein